MPVPTYKDLGLDANGMPLSGAPAPAPKAAQPDTASAVPSYADMGLDANGLPPAARGGERRTSKGRNFLMQLAGALTNHPEAGTLDALSQVGGNPDEAIALQRRGLGFGAGLTVGAIPITLAAGTGLPLGAALLAGAGEGALSGALGGATEGVVGGHSPRETAQLAGQGALWGGALGGAVRGAGSLIGHGWSQLEAAAGSKALATIDDAADAIPSLAHGPEIQADAAAREVHLAAIAEDAQRVRKELSGLVAARAPMSIRAVQTSDALQVLRKTLEDLDPNVWSMSSKDVLALAKKAGRKIYRLVPDVKVRKPQNMPTFLISDQAKAARQAFEDALPQGRVSRHYTAEEITLAKNAARKAARSVRMAELQALTGRLQAADDAAELIPLTKAKAPQTLAEAGIYLKNLYIKHGLDISDFLRNTKFLGPAGPRFADMLDLTASITERVGGQWNYRYSQIAHGLKASERELIARHLAGEIPAANMSPKHLKVAKGIREIWDHVGDEAEKRGIKLVDQDLTRTLLRSGRSFKSLRAILKEAADKGIASANDFDALLGDMKGDLRAAMHALFRDEGDIVGNAAMVPFRRSVTALPVRYDPQYLKALAEAGSKEERAYIARYIAQHGGTEDEARAFLKANLGKGIDGPFEARGGSLQWSRNNLLDPAARIYDIDKIFPHYFDVSARRLASARVFGAGDELYKALREELQWAVTGAMPEGAPPQGLGLRPEGPAADGDGAEVLRMFDNVWKASQGRVSPYAAWEEVPKTIAQTMLLSPKTAMLQATQLVNPIVTHGAIRTLKAVLGQRFNPMLRNLGDVVGATLTDVRGNIIGETLQTHASRLNPFVKYAIRPMDAWTRRVSSIAGGLRAIDEAANLMKGGKKALEAAEYLSKLQMDVDGIASRGGKLTTEELRMAALHGSNITMHGGRIQNLPYNRLHPVGRMTGVLQNFGSMQAKYFQREILAPLRKGNVKPLATSLAAMGILSWPARAIEDALNGKNRKSAEEYFTELYISGMFGSAFRGYSYAAHPEYSPTESIVGAPISATGRLAQGAAYGLHGEWDKAYEKLAPNWVKQTINLGAKVLDQ